MPAPAARHDSAGSGARHAAAARPTVCRNRVPGQPGKRESTSAAAIGSPCADVAPIVI
jgi:hypothetical protein